MTYTSDYLRFRSLISHLTGANNYTWIFYSNGRKMLLSKPLSYFEKQLADFIRIHKTALVNPKYISAVHAPLRRRMTASVQMAGGEVLPVGRRRWPILLDVLQLTQSKTPAYAELFEFSASSQGGTEADMFDEGEQTKNRLFVVMDDDLKAIHLQHVLEEKWPDFKPTFFTGVGALQKQLLETPDEELPVLIMLSLRKAESTTLDTLQFIKSSLRFSFIPTLVFCDSTAIQYTGRCYELGANSVISYSAENSQFEQTLDWLLQYWLKMVAFPVVKPT